jgi:flagellin
MASYINTNVSSLNAQRNLTTSQGSLATSLQRLSSGLRINSAKDDAAGLSISERFSSQIRGTDQARRNANDGISLSQTAEGALQATGDALQRIRELAVQSANSTNTASDRKTIQAEVGSLLSEIDRVSQTTEFNGQKLLDGTFGTAQFQVGANANQTISATTGNFRTNNYGNNQASTTFTAAPAATAVWSAATNLTINGLATSSAIAVATTDTATAVAKNINAVSSTTGVSASARTTALATFTAAGVYTVGITSDNSTVQNVSFTVGATANSDGLASAVSAINDATSKTGVTAQLNTAGTDVILTNANGNDILLTNNSATSTFTVESAIKSATAGTADTYSAATAALAAAGAGTAGIKGTITYNSDHAFSVTSSTAGEFTASNTSTQNTVNGVDVSTATGANDAIKIIDSALSIVNAQRGTFGALQSRFSTAIANLQTTSENLSASRSRIQDTDFAAETANLTRGQILQQAGTAMLAQANSLPNGVLALLRG